MLRVHAPRGRARVDELDESGAWSHTYGADVALGQAPPAAPYAWYLADRSREFRYLVFDLDTKGGDVGRDLAELVDLLDAAGVRHLVCRSGPSGGMHVWAPVIPVPADRVRALALALRRRLPTLDVSPLLNPRTGCVRPPGSPHRAGGWSRPVHLATGKTLGPVAAAAVFARPNGADALERLAVLLDVDQDTAELAAHGAGRAVEQTGRGPRLAVRRRPADVADLLTVTPEPGAGHAHLFRVLVRLALAGWDAAEVAAHLEAELAAPGLAHLRRAGGRTGRPRSTAEREALLARQWARALDYAATLRPAAPIGEQGDQGDGPTEWAAQVAEVVEAVAAWRERLAARPQEWSGQAGPSDRKTFERLLEAALEAVTLDLDFDCRRLALDTGMSRATAARSLHRLILEGRLELVEPGEGRRAHRYRIMPPPPEVGEQEAAGPLTCGGGETQGNPPPATPLPCPLAERARHLADLSRRRMLVSHDLFAHPYRGAPGLGRHLAVTTAALVDAAGPVTLADLVERTGYSPATVARHLDHLHGHQIARTAARGSARWRRATTSLDTVARRLGAVGTRERRHREYAAERAAFAWWLAELDWRRAPGKRRRGGRPAAAPGQARIIVPGAPSYANRARFPLTDQGRPDYRAARTAPAVA